MKTPPSLFPKWEGKRWQVVKPAAKKSYMAVASSDPGIVPESVGGTWYPAKPGVSGKPGTVILHFHGGAYVIGDGRTQDAGFAAKTLVANTEATHVFAPQYRLASNPNGRFPAALQDAITAYSYLINIEGIPAKKIVLSGDSAGANLALALTKYLTEHGSVVELDDPLAALLWSIWPNPNKSLTSEAFDNSPNKGTDYITAAFGNWGARTYLPDIKYGLNLDSPYISFENNPYKTSVPLYFSAGECEVLFHDIIKVYDQFNSIPGNNVQFQIEEYCVHDTILTGKIVGFEKEARQGAKRAGEWLRKISA